MNTNYINIFQRDGQATASVGKWQLCPKCNGQGIVSRPPWISAEISTWSGTSLSYICDVCKGAKIIARPHNAE